jgi:hypothetical protein
MKNKPSNQFVAEVRVNFPDDHPYGINLLRWFNLQNCGKETVPVGKSISTEHLSNMYRLHQGRVFKFVFEITKEGEWKFVGRKE